MRIPASYGTNGFPGTKSPGKAMEGTGRILLVDDESAVLDVTKRLLGRMGYQVVASRDSVEALGLFRMAHFLFDLVITDMTMPRMMGDELALRIMEIRPGIPVILSTGFSEHISEEKAKAIGIKEFIMKPSSMQDLAWVVRKVLRGDTSTGLK
jgi:CheY-like chemotaxis protein